jgi:hypothetical protein
MSVRSAIVGSLNTVGNVAPPAFKNLIINGAMQVAQRGTSTTGATGAVGVYAADRFLTNISNFGTWTITNENDAPTGSGFRKSAKYLVTTADASPAATDYAAVLQKIEGQNLQQILKGTSSAKQLSLSFWVKSNVTGTHSVMIYDNDNARFTSFTYTISASATWEKKTITIPADTTGAFDNDNSDSLQIYWNLGSGSTYTGGSAQTSWSSGTAFGSQWMPSQTNVSAATNNYWQITGVQLEVGSVATDYEFKPIDVELAQCQRYYQKSYNQGTNPGTAPNYVGVVVWSSVTTGAFGSAIPVYFKTTMRATPTVTIYNPETGTAGSIRGLSAGNNFNGTAEYIGDNGFSMYATATQSSAGFLIGTHYVAQIEL